MLKIVIKWLLVRENITFLIAVLGFLLSIGNLAFSLISHRRSFKLHVYDIKTFQDVLFMNVGIENRSRLSVSIMRVSLVQGKNKHFCTATPTLIYKETTRLGATITSEKETLSTPLPINVPGLGAQSAIILFEGLQDLPKDDATNLTVVIRSNRGCSSKMKLQLPEDWASRNSLL